MMKNNFSVSNKLENDEKLLADFVHMYCHHFLKEKYIWKNSNLQTNIFQSLC